MESRQLSITLGEGEKYRNITAEIQHAVNEMFAISPGMPAAFGTPRVGQYIPPLNIDSMRNQFIHVFVEHTTCALIIQEDEPCMLNTDFFNLLERLVPMPKPREKGYLHDDLEVRTTNIEPGRKERINGHAHLRASLFPQSQILRISGGKLHLGRYQQVLFFDFDDIEERQKRTILISDM